MARVLTSWLPVAVGLGAWVAGVVSCATATPEPVTGSHSGTRDSFLRVPKPPEPVRIEVLSPQPDERAVWIDGYWHWSGRRWVWRDGVWTIPPEGAYYAPPEFTRRPIEVYDDGGSERQIRGYSMELLYRPGHWHLADGGIAPVRPYEPRDAGR
jgi:hypothetical protein